MMAIENYPLRRRGTRNQAIKVLHPLQMMPNVVIYSDPSTLTPNITYRRISA